MSAERDRRVAECEAACTSGCHASDCEHHGHIAQPDVTALTAEVARLREALTDAVICLEAEADHPRPDPREAMRLWASFARAALEPKP